MWVLILFALTMADEISHHYVEDERVILWLTKLGPIGNPQETYPFSSIPFCYGDEEPAIREMKLTEKIAEHEIVDSKIPIKFQQSHAAQFYCRLKFDTDSVNKIADAIKRHFWFKMVLDGLPIYSKLGFAGEDDPAENINVESTNEDIQLFTQHNFAIQYNQDRIIQVQYTPSVPVQIFDSANAKITNKEVKFTYSVTWVETDHPFESRFDIYLDSQFFEGGVHWMSIGNSFVMVIFMVGLVALIMTRMLSRDIRDVRDADELEAFDGLSEVTGWKQITGEVFRSPSSLAFFTSLISTGYQLISVAVIIIGRCLLGHMYEQQDTLVSHFLIAYCILAVFGGFWNGRYYGQNKGTHWIRSMIIGCMLFPAAVIGIELFLTVIAIIWGSTATTYLELTQVIALMTFVHFPLYTVGTVIGKNTAKEPKYPCKINPVNNPILKEKTVYQEPAFLILTGGLLPFASISVEAYFIFSSFWNYKFYYVFGFMAVAFIFLALTLCCVAIVTTYILLNSEDPRWAWVSFLSCGGTSFYVFLYSLYFYLYKTNMHGVFQFLYFMGYTTIFSLVSFLVCGTIGFTASYYFVTNIYSRVKQD